MTRTRSRRIFFASLAAGVACLLIALPFLVPAERIRGRLERILGSYVQQGLRIEGEAHVRFLPGITVEFANVRAIERNSDRVLMTADKAQASVDLLQYLMGRSPFTSVNIERPVLRVRMAADWGEAFERKRLARLRPVNLSLDDARVVLVDGSDAEIDRLEGLDLAFRWPREAARARFSSTFTWHGEAFSASGQGIGPSELAGGDTGNLSLSMTSALHRLAFSGKAVVVDKLQLDGALSLSVSRPTDLIRLARGAVPASLDLGRVDLDGRLRSVGIHAQLADARLRLGTTQAEGVLSAQWDGLKPQVRGTLDFGRVVVTQGIVGGIVTSGLGLLADPDILRAADVDLRVSAADLALDWGDIRRFAATAVVREGKLRLQVAEARIFEGALTAGVTVEPKAAGLRFAVQARFDQMALPAVARLIGLPEFSSGQVSGDLKLSGAAAGDAMPPRDLTAQLTAEARNIVVKAGAAGKSETPRSFSFATARLDTAFSGMQVAVSKLIAEGPQTLVSLNGAIDLLRRTVLLDGVETRGEIEGPGARETRTVRLSGPLSGPQMMARDATAP